MTATSTRDNTSMSIVVVLSLAAAVALMATLIGLSEKPEIDGVAIVINSEAASAGQLTPPTPAPNFGFDVGDDEATTADTDSGQVGDGQVGGTPTGDTASALDQQQGSTEEAGPDERPVIPIPTPEPTVEPTPTPEVAAAVAPTPSPATEADAPAGEVQAAPSLPTRSGTVEGSFFTKSHENDGAVVAKNLVTVTFAEDGSGAFQGVLDITYGDGTHILLNMSGPVTWLPTNPQVETNLSGSFTLDAVIDADDVTQDDAELIIRSLEAGSGSLCTSQCFGFTFPSQTG